MKKSFDLRVFRDNNYEKNLQKAFDNIEHKNFIIRGKTHIVKSKQKIKYHRFFKGNYYMKSYNIVTGITRLEINDNIVRTKEGKEKFYYDMDGKVVKIK